jgi:8-oxo-dGTP diphosphatase
MKLTVDIVVRRGDEYLFIRRKFPPFQDELAFPGGFVEEHESVPDAAVRELQEETGIEVWRGALKLIDVFSAPNRDPRGRIVSIAYFVKVPLATEAYPSDDAGTIVWLDREQALKQELAFDHRHILETAL